MVPLLSLALLAAPATGVDEVPEEQRTILILDFDAEVGGEGYQRLVTDQVAVELSERGDLKVMTEVDLKRLSQMEAERQAVGCEQSAECLAELAGAIGADLVAYGNIGRLGELLIVNVSIFNAKQATSFARVNIRTKDPAELPERIEKRLNEVFGAEVDEAVPPMEAPIAWQPVVGWSLVGVGSAAVLSGLIFAGLEADNVDTAGIGRAAKDDALFAGRVYLVVAGVGALMAGGGAYALWSME